MAEVFLNVSAWVVSTPNTTKTLRGTMSKKKFSHLVEISSTLQELRKDLVEKGSTLQKLLNVPYPNANAVCAAVGEIQHLLERDDICDVRGFRPCQGRQQEKSNLRRKRCSQGEFFIDCLLRPCISLINLFLCLGDVASDPQLRASVVRSFRA